MMAKLRLSVALVQLLFEKNLGIPLRMYCYAFHSGFCSPSCQTKSGMENLGLRLCSNTWWYMRSYIYNYINTTTVHGWIKGAV